MKNSNQDSSVLKKIDYRTKDDKFKSIADYNFFDCRDDDDDEQAQHLFVNTHELIYSEKF